MSTAIEELVKNASKLVNAGRWAEAEAVWLEVHRLDADHPQALYGLGFHAFHRQDFAAARRWLEQAVERAPQDVLARLTLSSLYGALGEVQMEREAIESALVIDPYSLPGLLLKAGWFERVGKAAEAAAVYGHALQVAPVPSRWPESLRSQLEHGKAMVARRSSALAAYLRGELRASYEVLVDNRQSKWMEAIDLLAGVTKPFHTQCNQLHVPRLPAIPFYERQQFPWLAAIEEATPIILEELSSLLAGARDEFSPYIAYAPGQPLNQWAALNHSQRWSTYHLWRDGQEVAENLQRCPETARVLRQAPLAQIPALCPNVMFSVLAPKTRIPPHHGETNARLVAHLPLIVPPDCGLRVGYEERCWTVGETLIFDDCVEHEAYNDSEEIRVVLIFDLWNPHLDDQERILLQNLTLAAQNFKG